MTVDTTHNVDWSSSIPSTTILESSGTNRNRADWPRRLAERSSGGQTRVLFLRRLQRGRLRAGAGTRTPGLRITNALLYQLSYPGTARISKARTTAPETAISLMPIPPMGPNVTLVTNVPMTCIDAGEESVDARFKPAPPGQIPDQADIVSDVAVANDWRLQWCGAALVR